MFCFPFTGRHTARHTANPFVDPYISQLLGVKNRNGQLKAELLRKIGQKWGFLWQKRNIQLFRPRKDKFTV